MEIANFTKEDMVSAVNLAWDAWHNYFDGLSDEAIHRMVECIVRHNYTDEDLAFKIVVDGEMKGFIFGTRKGKITDLSGWVGAQCKVINPEEMDLLVELNEYMDEADRNTIAEMDDGDVKLSLFISIQKGCGKELLDTITQEFIKQGYKRMFLYTDTACNHEYYPAHGFTMVSKYRNKRYSVTKTDFWTYIYRKTIEN